MNRINWQEPVPNNNLLDLSKNICYDQVLLNKIKVDDISIFKYPDSFLAYKSLADFYHVDIGNLILGFGSSELILRILQSYKAYSIGIVSPTWALTSLYSLNIGMSCQESVDINELNTDILYVANPNGITGKVLDKNTILELLPKFKLVIVDEAYGDFADQSLISESLNNKNLIVVKTLSKTVAAPGIRIGYAFSNKTTIELLQNQRPGYVTFGATIPLLIKLLPEINSHLDRMKETKLYIESKYDTVPSNGNFVLFKQNPDLPCQVKNVESGLFRMALTDLETFKGLEREDI